MRLELRPDGTIVYHDSPYGPYHVVPKVIDRQCKYDLDELKTHAIEHPEDVIDPTHIAGMAKITELEQYLSNTDWYAVRFAETGKPIPEDVTTQRNAARERISELRAKE